MYNINACEMNKIEFNYLLKLQYFKRSSKEFFMKNISKSNLFEKRDFYTFYFL